MALTPPLSPSSLGWGFGPGEHSVQEHAAVPALRVAAEGRDLSSSSEVRKPSLHHELSSAAQLTAAPPSPPLQMTHHRRRSPHTFDFCAVEGAEPGSEPLGIEGCGPLPAFPTREALPADAEAASA